MNWVCADVLNCNSTGWLYVMTGQCSQTATAVVSACNECAFCAINLVSASCIFKTKPELYGIYGQREETTVLNNGTGTPRVVSLAVQNFTDFVVLGLRDVGGGCYGNASARGGYNFT